LAISGAIPPKKFGIFCGTIFSHLYFDENVDGDGKGVMAVSYEDEEGESGKLKNTVEFLAPIRYCRHRMWSHVVRVFGFSV
jgi:hypothetical protein